MDNNVTIEPNHLCTACQLHVGELKGTPIFHCGKCNVFHFLGK